MTPLKELLVMISGITYGIVGPNRQGGDEKK
jgi:hypothetical protein